MQSRRNSLLNTREFLKRFTPDIKNLTREALYAETFETVKQINPPKELGLDSKQPIINAKIWSIISVLVEMNFVTLGQQLLVEKLPKCL